MHLRNIELENYRNYKSVSLAFDNGATILAGENAQGKTNLLEAIFILTGEKSWRASKKSDIISFSKPFATINADVTSRERDFNLRLNIPLGGKQQTFINSIKQKRQSELAEIFRCVLFSPDDLFLIKDGPSARRKFIDTALCQLRPRYATALSEYGRLYDHKSKILKTYEDNQALLELLPDFTAKMAYYGAAIIRYRAYFCKKLSEFAAKIHSNVAGEDEKLTLLYKTVSNITDIYADEKTIENQLLEHAEAHFDAEMRSGNCLSGPHKDDLEIFINNRAARLFASQGQSRTAALSLKFAEREMIFDDCGEYPVMLLDDVLSELDQKRQKFLLSKTGMGQVIITCCEKSENLKNLDAKTYFIENGIVK